MPIPLSVRIRKDSWRRPRSKMSLDDLFSQIQAGNLKELNIIVKADVQGSVEAVKQSLLKALQRRSCG